MAGRLRSGALRDVEVSATGGARRAAGCLAMCSVCHRTGTPDAAQHSPRGPQQAEVQAEEMQGAAQKVRKEQG